jgi:putative tricarboxylic transport membrane protein
MILGAILGPMAEVEFRRSMQLSEGDPGIFFSTGFTYVLYPLLALTVFGPMIWKAVKKKGTEASK